MKNKNSIYLCIIFMTISFFGSLGFSIIQSLTLDDVINEICLDKDQIEFNINNCEKITNAEFMNTIKNIDNIYIEKNGFMSSTYKGKAIFFNKSILNIPNMINGKFFNIKDFEKNKPKAIVGKSVYDNISIKIGKTRYIKYDNSLYEIIGVMGYEDKNSILDNQFFINLNSYVMKSNNLIYTKKLKTNNYKKIVKEFTNKYDDIEFEEVNNIQDNSNNYSQVYLIMILIISVIFMNVVNVTLQWIESRKKEIGIKKALGGTNFRIALEILFENQVIASISYFVGCLIYLVIIKSKFIPILGNAIYVMGLFKAFIFSSFIALIVSMISIINILKVKPSIIMKGGK